MDRETFEAWREPRAGTTNPARLDNPHWDALVREQPWASAYRIAQRFEFERPRGTGPTWCFDRFGRTTTALPDGCVVHVAGEHEDHYDPDFYIYNDVVVVAPDGALAFYGYPREVFPPTDFHSATLAGDTLWLVGSLGYRDQRHPGTTQVCRLDLATFAIEQVATTGSPPGWIKEHTAELVGRSIVVRGGSVYDGARLVENIDDWSLDLESLAWTRLTVRDWQRWSMRPTRASRTFLSELRHMKWEADNPSFRSTRVATARDELGGEPELERLDTLYRFADAEVLEQGDSFNVYRIRLDGVLVRFTEDWSRIDVVVEGTLSDTRLRGLQKHVLDDLRALHAGAPWTLEAVLGSPPASPDSSTDSSG